MAADISSTKLESGIVYTVVNGQELRADLYTPASSASAPNADGRGLPVAVLIHGGRWTWGSRTDMAPLAQAIAAWGWAALAIDYRQRDLFGFVKWRDQPADIETALRWVQQQAGTRNLDPNCMVLIGGSSGGHLVALVGASSVNTGLRGAIALWGPTDFALPRDSMSPELRDLLDWLLGPNYSESEARAASPRWRLVPQAIPRFWLLAHGTEDRMVSIEQSRRFVADLKWLRAPAYLLELPGEGHSLLTPAGWAQVDFVMRHYLLWLADHR